MATTSRTLLFLFISLIIFTLSRVTALSEHHSSSPSNNNDGHHADLKDHYQHAANRENSNPLIPDDHFNKIFCNLGPGSWPSEYSQDLVILSAKNISDCLATNRYVVVFFYMYWCPPCQKMAAEYLTAAEMLKGEAVLAMVDAVEEEGLREKYNVTEYPMVYFFVGGVKLHHFVAERTR